MSGWLVLTTYWTVFGAALLVGAVVVDWMERMQLLPGTKISDVCQGCYEAYVEPGETLCLMCHDEDDGDETAEYAFGYCDGCGDERRLNDASLCTTCQRVYDRLFDIDASDDHVF